jgi:methionyl-tRNA synthetase
MSGTFYITTPIYYVNDVPHIGHAYTTVAADVLARYHALRGDNSYFLTGTDEHGQKILRSAEAKGMTAQELADKTVINFQELWKVLDIRHNDFIRTTEKRHEKVVQAIFSRLLEQGDIYKGTYEGLYCVPCETYVPEAQMGEGQSCPDCGRKLEKMTEESYFFRLSKYAEPLLEYYEKNPEAILPKGRRNEIMSFIRGGLLDQSISRTTIRWGVPVPGDDRHVVYVWFDALINYLSALDYPEEGGKWQTYWPEVHHLVGKDIIRFHSVIWPAMLLALGLNPPVRVFAHGWWTVEGDKMSKSKGNVVDPFEMVDLYGADAFRYFLLREVPFGVDGDFSEKALAGRINSDLANDLGNLLNRTLQMIEKNCDGKIPPVEQEDPLDEELKKVLCDTVVALEGHMELFALDEALKSLWALVRRGNKYIDETMPWKLAKDGDLPRLNTVLHTLCQVLRTAAILVSPFMPSTARKMEEQLGLKDLATQGGGDTLCWDASITGASVHKGEVLFPRIDLKIWEEEKAARDARKGLLPDPGDHEEEIAIEDFKKVEMRVAKILQVEAVKKADRLYKLLVDLGYERRTIVSSIREFFTPEELEGKTIIVICNLKPAKFRGIESHGMLCAAETEDGKTLSLLTLDTELPPGMRVH